MAWDVGAEQWLREVTLSLPKNSKAKVPSLAECVTEVIPPRNPIVATGVVMVAPPVCVACPPTTRRTPLLNDSAISPCAVAGLNTNLSMTRVEFGPTFSVVLSMKTSCTLPVAEVSIFSSAHNLSADLDDPQCASRRRARSNAYWRRPPFRPSRQGLRRDSRSARRGDPAQEGIRIFMPGERDILTPAGPSEPDRRSA